MRPAKALARLRICICICADSPEPSQVDFVMGTIKKHEIGKKTSYYHYVYFSGTIFYIKIFSQPNNVMSQMNGIRL